MKTLVVRHAIALTLLGTLASLTADAAPGTLNVTISMTEFRFSPSTVTVPAGGRVRLTLVNRGSVAHEFMVYPRSHEMEMTAPRDMHEFAWKNTYSRGIGEIAVAFAGRGTLTTDTVVEVEVVRRGSATISFTAAKRGTFEFGCHTEGHYEAGMKGTLVVR